MEEEKLEFVSRFLYIKNHNNAEKLSEYQPIYHLDDR